MEEVAENMYSANSSDEDRYFLEAREKAILEKLSIQEYIKQLVQKNTELRQKNAELRQKNAELRQKNAELRQKIAAQEQRIAELERMLAEKDL